MWAGDSVSVRMEWKSAVVAFRLSGRGMNSWPAPLITVIGTIDPDTLRN